MPTLIQSSYTISLLARLPYDIQEDITEHLDQSDLHALSVASKYLSSLAARALYARVNLHSSCVAGKPSPAHRAPHVLRTRQFSFFKALYEHPEYANFVRHLAYEFTDCTDPKTAVDTVVPDELAWKAFAKCKGVTSLHITMFNGHGAKPPPQRLFPNLKHATVSGTFPPMALDRLLHASTRLQSLHIAGGTSEHIHLPQQRPAWTSSLSPFITRSIRIDAFKTLKNLSFESHHSNKTTTISSSSLFKFLKHVIPHLEELTLCVTADTCVPDDEICNAQEVFQVVERGQCLRSLCLKGKIAMDSEEVVKQIGSRFPKLKVQTIVDTHEGTPSVKNVHD
jgi:hypothetical protein